MQCVTLCGVVSVDKPSLTLSPTTPNQLIMLIGSDALSLDAGGRWWRLGAPHPTACWHWQMHQEFPLKGKCLQKLLPPPPPPLTLSAKCKAQNIWAYLFYVCLLGLRAFEQKQGDDREKFTPGDLHTAATINSVTLRATLFPCESVGAIHHPTALHPAATGHTAWTKQDRRLILLSLLDFNWKAICLWLNFLSCLSQSLVDQKKCKLKENILDVPGFKVEHG